MSTAAARTVAHGTFVIERFGGGTRGLLDNLDRELKRQG